MPKTAYEIILDFITKELKLPELSPAEALDAMCDIALPWDDYRDLTWHTPAEQECLVRDRLLEQHKACKVQGRLDAAVRVFKTASNYELVYISETAIDVRAKGSLWRGTLSRYLTKENIKVIKSVLLTQSGQQGSSSFLKFFRPQVFGELISAGFSAQLDSSMVVGALAAGALSITLGEVSRQEGGYYVCIKDSSALCSPRKFSSPALHSAEARLCVGDAAAKFALTALRSHKQLGDINAELRGLFVQALLAFGFRTAVDAGEYQSPEASTTDIEVTSLTNPYHVRITVASIKPSFNASLEYLYSTKELSLDSTQDIYDANLLRAIARFMEEGNDYLKQNADTRDKIMETVRALDTQR